MPDLGEAHGTVKCPRRTFAHCPTHCPVRKKKWALDNASARTASHVVVPGPKDGNFVPPTALMKRAAPRSGLGPWASSAARQEGDPNWAGPRGRTRDRGSEAGSMVSPFALFYCCGGSARRAFSSIGSTGGYGGPETHSPSRRKAPATVSARPERHRLSRCDHLIGRDHSVCAVWVRRRRMELESTHAAFSCCREAAGRPMRGRPFRPGSAWPSSAARC